MRTCSCFNLQNDYIGRLKENSAINRQWKWYFVVLKCGSENLNCPEDSRQMTSLFLLRGRGFPCFSKMLIRVERRKNVLTHPKNFNAVTEGGLFCPSILTFIVLIVRNSHWAFSPSGVPSAVQVRNVMEPSGPPVARTPRWEYSRSWNAIEVIVGTRAENDDVFVRSKHRNVSTIDSV